VGGGEQAACTEYARTRDRFPEYGSNIPTKQIQLAERKTSYKADNGKAAECCSQTPAYTLIHLYDSITIGVHPMEGKLARNVSYTCSETKRNSGFSK
jgi:hypothetical protein